MSQALPLAPVLRVVPPGAYDAAVKAQQEERAAAQMALSQPVASNLANWIRGQYQIFRLHRNDAMAGWSERLLAALRAFNGQYDASKLAEIRKFGGSEVYARIIALKCRGASSLLRDVYLGQDRPWGISPPTDPEIPQNIIDGVRTLVMSEASSLQQAGQTLDPHNIRDRVLQLMSAARDAAKKRAAQQAKVAEEKVDEILREGGFYDALAEFLVDLTLFPFACIKGPTVRIVPSVNWQNGKAVTQEKPRLFWERVSPFDLWWTPGVSDIQSGNVIQRSRVTRSDLNDALDLPGYNVDEVRAVLDEYGAGGLYDDWDNTDSERAVQENRENPVLNRSGMIACLEMHGNVQGKLLLEYGMDPKQVPDELRDYHVQAWLIGTHVIKVQLSPSPRKRHPYYITSFEKVPGTPVGNGLPDILGDIQDVGNATLRALVNNLSIASGPQVVVNDKVLATSEDGEEMYPWKRWHIDMDPIGTNSQEPVSFFQPTSNAEQLLSVYQAVTGMADEISAIPKYLSGQAPGGAGRTASGLAMLMGNASKILQTVAANIDGDVIEPGLTDLFDMLMLTDTSGLLTGEENIRVMGVAVAVQRETQRSRQLEFLQITANPLDMQIIGPKGRAAVLRSVSQTIGLDGEQIVPSDEQLAAAQQSQQSAPAPQPPGAGAPQAAAQAQGGQSPTPTGDMGPRTNSVVPRVNGGVG